MPTTLIASLGQSPGAVTGLFYALQREPDIFIDQLIVVRTTDRDVLIARNQVEKYLRDANPDCKVTDLEIPDDETFNLAAAQKIIVDCIEQQHDVLLGITGGRTSIGVMMALAGQLYPDIVKGMFHFWVRPSIERDGHVSTVKRLQPGSAELNRIMRPNQDDCKALRIPTLSLLSEALQERKDIQTTPSLELKYSYSGQDLEYVNEILSLLPRRMTVEQAERFVKVANEVKQGRPVIETSLAEILGEAGVIDASEAIASLHMLSKRPDDIMTLTENWISEQERHSNRRYWVRGLRKTYQRHKDGINTSLATADTGIGLASMIISLLSLHLQIGG